MPRRASSLILPLLSALTLFTGSSLILRAIARHFYDQYWPGHPDSFRAEIALLPGLAFTHENDYFWTDTHQAIIFLTASCSLAVPPLLALGLSRGKAALAAISLATLALAASDVNLIWNRYDSYFKLFLPKEWSIRKVFDLSRPDILWVLALSLAGLLVGFTLRLLLDRRLRSRGLCACGYDLRVQAALQIPRCPECGAETPI